MSPRRETTKIWAPTSRGSASATSNCATCSAPSPTPKATACASSMPRRMPTFSKTAMAKTTTATTASSMAMTATTPSWLKVLDIRLNTAVTQIEWSGGVAVTSASGERFCADIVIITLPLGVLQSGHVRFDPPLPPIKEQALAGLKMGPVMKMVYLFAEPILDPSIGAIYAKGNPPMWWSPSLGREEEPGRLDRFLHRRLRARIIATGRGSRPAKGTRDPAASHWQARPRIP